jgi:hypothetical protein
MSRLFKRLPISLSVVLIILMAKGSESDYHVGF